MQAKRKSTYQSIVNLCIMVYVFLRDNIAVFMGNKFLNKNLGNEYFGVIHCGVEWFYFFGIFI